MNCKLYLFSPTGGTEKVAKVLCSALGDATQMIDLSSQSFGGGKVDAAEGDIAVIATPSFGGRVPAVAAERIRLIDGNQLPCVVLCVYGNRAYDDTLVELADLAKESNFRVAAAVAAVAEHSIMHQYATGRPDAQDEEKLKEIAGQIVQKLSEAQTDHEPEIPGNRPYKQAGGAGLVPKAGKACVNCGLCAAQCPVGAIDKADVTKTDNKKCISCMRCVAKCPKQARTVSHFMVSVAAMTIKKACSVRKECEVYL